jgi:hypothetical protein
MNHCWNLFRQWSWGDWLALAVGFAIGFIFG